jgi:processive 1,2-diacylglycerol beta-glucosyltransferase
MDWLLAEMPLNDGEDSMVKIYDESSGRVYGSITDAQLQAMIDQLEEESREDRDYYINAATIDMFEERGLDAGLVALLRNALGDREDMDIRWARE